MMQTLDEIVASFFKWYILYMKAFILPLLFGLFVKIVGFRSENDVCDLGLVQDIEEASILAVEPGCVERRHDVLGRDAVTKKGKKGKKGSSAERLDETETLEVPYFPIFVKLATTCTQGKPVCAGKVVVGPSVWISGAK